MSKSSFVGLICFLLLALVQAAPDGRIVGGSTAKKGQFPFQISLKKKGTHICGGSIISKNYILTAGHCVLDVTKNYQMIPASELEVHAGTNHIKKGGIKIPVAQIAKHPDYFRNETHYNYDDLATLKLKKPLTFSETIQPITLYVGQTKEGTPVSLSGWGHLRYKGTNSNELQFIVLKSTEKDCYWPKKLICLDHPPNKGFCHGDSGGPGVAYGKLVGVSSMIKGVCATDQPDALIKVARYIDWIKAHSDV